MIVNGTKEVLLGHRCSSIALVIVLVIVILLFSPAMIQRPSTIEEQKIDSFEPAILKPFQK
jgi:hypothetical protein